MTDSLEGLRARLDGGCTSAEFRAALMDVPAVRRERHIDALFQLDELPDDLALPRGCVPYLPCSLDVLLEAIDVTSLTDEHVFVDVGAGIGRVAALVHLLSGARAIGVEIQSALARRARSLAARVAPSRIEIIEGDATNGALPDDGDVYFLYCPFDRNHTATFLERLAPRRGARIVCVDLVLPERPWLECCIANHRLSVFRIMDGREHGLARAASWPEGGALP